MAAEAKEPETKENLDNEVPFDAASFHNDPLKKTTDWSAGYIPLFHQHFKNLINKKPENENQKINILDAGCGIGVFTNYLHGKLNGNSSICNVYGVDVSKDAIKTAQEQNKGPIFTYIEPYKALPFKAHFFDIIICTFVISTIPRYKLKLFFESVFPIINKQNGKFIVVINNPKECVDTRFAGIQIVYDGKDNKPKPFDDVTIKFYHGTKAKKPYISDKELWRPTELIMEMLKDIFEKDKCKCNIEAKDLMYLDIYENDVKALGIDINEIQTEKEKAPFTSIVLTMNN
eukprot:313098_1